MTQPRILEGLSDLPAWLALSGAERVLVITTPARRFVPQLPLEGLEVSVFDRAAVHVPRPVLDDALRIASSFEPDTVISIGGGSATGLAKALRLEIDARLVAIPTTYSASEMTNLYGILEGGVKRTARDDRVRPDAVVHDAALFVDLPKAISVASLLNALAHPISALSTGSLDERARRDALLSIERLSFALEQLLQAPQSIRAHQLSLSASASAGAVLDGGSLGLHHEVAHALGGTFRLEHAGIHAALLPHFVGHLFADAPTHYEAVREAFGHRDVPARLYEALERAGAPRSLVELGIPHVEFERARAASPLLDRRFVEDAQLGRPPSIYTRRWTLTARPDTSVRGPELADASKVVIALHGRGSNADRGLREIENWIGHDPSIAIVAPQAPRNEWYGTSYRAPAVEMGPVLAESLRAVEETLARVLEHTAPSQVYLAGFSQGACLAAEAFARTNVPLGGLLAMTGARLGPRDAQPKIARDLRGATVVLGAAERDSWLTAEDIRQLARDFADEGAEVHLSMSAGEVHEVTLRQRMLANRVIHGRGFEAGARGFGNAHEMELLRGALPRRQNGPRRPAYGLHAEQISGTGFIAPRHGNQRTWFYRIRPSAQHSPFVALSHDTLRDDWDDAPADPNLLGYAPLAEPQHATDFVDGLATVGGAGHPRLRRGYAIHVYRANRSMEHRALCNTDGDLLIVPQLGRLVLQTELGLLPVRPGEIAILPRGLRASVHLEDPFARGWVGEVYGRHFTLPERGPVGANGLADPRHFRLPVGFFEDRIDVGYRVTTKHQNALFDSRQDYLPYDVVAWHGNYAPYAYDLMDFAPAGSTRFDHPDPSIHLVLSAPLDEHGADSLDFLFFPPRWDATEHSFRPPYFHRNAIVEFNGIIADPTLSSRGPFEAGGYFVTPPMTPHGVLAHVAEAEHRRSGESTDRPVRMSDHSKWFQLESAMPFGLTSWGRTSENRIATWPQAFGAYRRHFDVNEP